MHAKKRLLLACALGVALVPTVPVIAQAPPIAVLALRSVVDPAGGRPALVALAVSQPSVISLTLVAPGGDPVLNQKLAVARTYRFVWTGTDAWGNPVPPGTYRLDIDCSCGRSQVSSSVELQVVTRGGPGGGNGPRPDPPTDVAVVAAQANTVSWTASPSKGVVVYRVYRSTARDGSFQRLGESETTVFSDVPGQKGIYWYRVTAVTSKSRESAPTGAISSDNVHMTQVVGPDGGTIAPTTGTVALHLPAGALPADTTFTIDQVSAPPPPASAQIAVSRSFELGPTGATFAVPATLTLRLDAPPGELLPSTHPADTTWVQYWNGSSWKSLRGAAVDSAQSTVEVPITHLTMFGAIGITLPHGNYSLETSLCGYCHSVHNAPGPSLRAYPTERETCYQCHNNGQGTKVNEVQQVTLTGSWLTGETFALTLIDQETGNITVSADPNITRTNILNALLDLPNINGSSAAPNPEPGVDGVSVAGTGPFTVTFQNGQGDQDVPQMTGRAIVSVGGTITVSTTTPGVGIWTAASTDLLGAFGETWPVTPTSTRLSSHPAAAARDGVQIECSDCHTAHRDPATFTKLLRRSDGSGGYIYSPVAGPNIGNQFCTLGCHDATSTYPAPFGDHTAFQGTAHDVANVPAANEVQQVAVDATGGTFTLMFAGVKTAAVAFNVSAASLQTALEGLTGIGAGNVLVTGGPGGAGAADPYVVTFRAAKAAKDMSALVSDPTLLTGGAGTAVVTTTMNGRAAQPSGDVRCLNCHDPHASDVRMLADASQETLCLSCHTQATPNTSGGTKPPWTAATGPFPGSNVFDAFNAVPNDYTAGSVRIYHHPISDTDQAGGTRQVECASCHNSHLSDRTDGATLSKAVDPTDVFTKWIFGWDFTSGYMSRGANVDAFCLTCHGTAPLPTAGPTVPYSIRMVNDGDGHELFNGATWPDSNHGYPDAPDTYNSCDARGVSNGDCVVTCTNCHDPHGSTNASMLRETIIPPDYVTFTVTNASWASDQGGVAALEYRTPSGLYCTASVRTGCTVGRGVTITITDVTWPGYDGTFVTTNSAVGSQRGPITYALADPGGSGPTGGTVAPPTSYTMTGWDGSSTSIRAWCLACHIERGPDHRAGACTACHTHEISDIGDPTL